MVCEDNKVISRKEAIEAGLKRYFTGKPCKRGHIAERYVNGCDCVCCDAEKGKKYYQENKEKKAEYYQENKEKIAEYHKKYSQENKEKTAEYDKKYYQENKEKIVERKKKYYQENKEKIVEQKKKYRQENKEKIVEWKKKYYQENKGYFYIRSKLRQKRVRKATPPWHESERDLISWMYREVKERNRLAGYKKYSVDHIIPFKNRKVCGLHTISNMQIITLKENLEKGNKLLPEHTTWSRNK